MYYFMIFLLAVVRPVTLTRCGKTNQKFDPFERILGGQVVAPGEFPWLVSLRRGTRNEHFCGGTLVDKGWVLTAAHCFKLSPEYVYTVVAGKIHNDRFESTQQISPVMNIYIHKDFQLHGIYSVNDIALVRLLHPFNISGEFVKPICLPDPYEEFTSNCILAGWGTTREEATKTSNVARKVTVPVIPNEQCQTEYHYLQDNMVCSGYKEGGKDSCKGDSGGPLMCLGADDRVYLTGIISSGNGCGKPSSPAINTKVSYFIWWIFRTMETFKLQEVFM